MFGARVHLVPLFALEVLAPASHRACEASARDPIPPSGDRSLRLRHELQSAGETNVETGYGTTRCTGLPVMLTCHVVVSFPPATRYWIFHQDDCVSPDGVRPFAP